MMMEEPAGPYERKPQPSRPLPSLANSDVGHGLGVQQPL
jgi:hypothetical protein